MPATSAPCQDRSMMTRVDLVLVASCALALVALAPTGCKNTACEDLAEVCARCPDNTIRTACETDVSNDVKSICSDRQAVYEPDCPVETSASSSSGFGPSSSSSGASTSSAGGGTTTSTTTSAAGGAGGAGGAG